MVQISRLLARSIPFIDKVVIRLTDLSCIRFHHRRRHGFGRVTVQANSNNRINGINSITHIERSRRQGTCGGTNQDGFTNTNLITNKHKFQFMQIYQFSYTYWLIPSILEQINPKIITLSSN